MQRSTKIIEEETKECYHFFQIIHSTQDPCLVIPNKFIRIFGKELSKSVVLKVPSGKKFDVQPRKDDGQVSFQNGFHEFMDYYSLEKGHFLMFRYEGNSRFSVVICDVSASEIGYPCDDVDQIQEEDSMVVFKQNDVRQKKNKSSFGTKQARRKRESSSARQNQKAELLVGTSKPISLQCRKMALRLAKEFTSKHPFCYVLMCPSYVSYYFVLTLPLGFSKKYLQGNTQSQDVTLLVPEGKTWKVNCSFMNGHVRFVKGWKTFVLDNELEEGDTCIFEPVDREKRELKVSIFRVLEDSKQVNKSLDHSNSQTKDAIPQRKKKRRRYSDSSHSKKDSQQKISNLVVQATKDVAAVQRPLATQVEERSAKDPRTFTSKNPYCTITMRHTYVNSSFSLNVPKDFADLYLKDAFQGITLSLPNGRKWLISLCVGDHRKLLAGWKTFVVDNQLKEEDVCIFELVDSKNIELKVFIFQCDP